MRSIIKLKHLDLFLSILLVVFANKVTAQQSTVAEGNRFMLKDLQELVLLNHPIVKQAGLLSEEAQAQVLQSLGKFDPAVVASFGRKNFGGTQYYNHWDSELKVPLWLAGADLNIGYDRNVGVYTNPETRTSNTGLSGVGLSIPLGQGLLIDARRNTLRQAKIMVSYAAAEKINQINSIWFTAVKDYWNWYFAYQQNAFTQEGVALAEKRFNAISAQVKIGDKPPIDSVEAAITMVDRRVQLQETAVKLNNARLVLSNHLWTDAGLPQELPMQAQPEAFREDREMVKSLRLDSLVLQSAEVHPLVLKMKSQQLQLGVEEKYRLEMLKPKLNIKGAFIAGRRDFSEVSPAYDFGPANYKIGVDFAFPLFLRAERGKLREVRVQQLAIRYGLEQGAREIQTDIRSAFNQLKAYEGQLALQSTNVTRQRILVDGEVSKFDLGESNLFLINTRETKLIEMQVKRAELIASFQKTLADLYYRAGRKIIYP